MGPVNLFFLLEIFVTFDNLLPYPSFYMDSHINGVKKLKFSGNRIKVKLYFRKHLEKKNMSFLFYSRRF